MYVRIKINNWFLLYPWPQRKNNHEFYFVLYSKRSFITRFWDLSLLLLYALFIAWNFRQWPDYISKNASHLSRNQNGFISRFSIFILLIPVYQINISSVASVFFFFFQILNDPETFSARGRLSASGWRLQWQNWSFLLLLNEMIWS